jgi:DNA (cytosine-5)-methyltransferase 1
MIHFSLFSGIGGFELASEWMGWNNYLSCELADFPNKVLKHYWPKAYHHRDIKTLNYDTIQDELTRRFGEWRTEPIILTGGFPCQPYSLAGQRKGKEDERHLWPEMLRLIHEIKPDFIVGENVFGLLNWNGGMVFDEVLTDLATAGYDVTPLVIPAAAVNAPHGRDRVWFVAQNAMLGGCVHGKDEQEGTEIWEFGNISPGNKDGVHLSKGDATNSNNFGSATGRTEIQKKNGEIPKRHDNTQFSNTDKSDATDTTSTRRRENIGRRKSRFNDQKSTSSNWQNFPTQSPICGGDDGLPTELDGVTFSKWRNESIKGYGNAIVPQVAYEIFKSIELAYSEITK